MMKTLVAIYTANDLQHVVEDIFEIFKCDAQGLERTLPDYNCSIDI